MQAAARLISTAASAWLEVRVLRPAARRARPRPRAEF